GVHLAFVPWILFLPPPVSEPSTTYPAIDTSVCRGEPRLTVAFVVTAAGDEASESHAPLPSTALPQPPLIREPLTVTVPGAIVVPPAPSVGSQESARVIPSAANGQETGNRALGGPGVPAAPALLAMPRQAQSVVY